VNVQGEQQQKLDVFANEEMIRALSAVPSVAACVSEEDEEPVLTGHAGGKYAVIFDPLDGSSNIDVNVNVGTIFGVQRVGKDLEKGILAAGTAQVAAGYVVYGPSTVMVLATAHPSDDEAVARMGLPAGVSCFTLDESGEFVRSAAAMRMPEQGPYYSANEANAAEWAPGYSAFVDMLLAKKLNGQTYSARYIGSLVADFHRTLLKGGIFFYPATAKAPGGKLRLLYEANPLAMVAEAAGGMASDGRERILTKQPAKVHERTALVVGSRAEVEALEALVAGENS
jgi:fructose-1,6-bisphosphatase I